MAFEQEVLFQKQYKGQVVTKVTKANDFKCKVRYLISTLQDFAYTGS